MDPYVKLEVGSKIYRTKTDQNAGKFPNWYDEFNIELTKNEVMKITMLEEDTMKDDLVGSATMDLSLVVNDPNRCFSDDIKIFYKGKSSGELFLSIDRKSVV